MAHKASKHENDVSDWLALERVPLVGPLAIARLMDGFGSPGKALKTSAREIRERAGLSERVSRTIADFVIPEDDIERDMETLARLDVEIVTRWDEDYPANLQEIYDPPAMLFVRGTLAAQDSNAVAVVGTRNPGRYGLEMTEQICRDLSRSGVTLISGLARGIDTACHRAALKESGRTIGVLGCGIDVTYPRENRGLIEEMTESGAVISEFRPGTPPHATNFYRRNRVVSGLSKGVVVVEASTKSGSLITARHAADQNRDVLAVPGNVMNLRSRGPHKLLKEGAGLVESGKDIMLELFSDSQRSAQPSLFEAKSDDSDLSDVAKRVLGSLEPDPTPIDDLCELLKIDAGKLSAVLLELELRGSIRQHPGKMFSRIMR